MAITDTDDDKRVEWSELPKELWPVIAKHLNATIDILRFRSTCTTWRSATPLPLPLPLPPPTPSSPSSSQSLFPPQTRIPHADQTLLQTKLYRLQPSTSTATPNICNSISKGWIIMVGDSKSTPLRLLDPFTTSPLSRSPPSSHLTRTRTRTHTHTSPPAPKLLNLLNFKIIELAEAYSLSSEAHRPDDDKRELGVFIPVPEVLKAVLFPSSNNKPRMVFALYKDGKLRVSTIGDVVWRMVLPHDGDGKMNSCFDDLIIHMGQVYVVDKWGTILWVDCCCLKLVQFSPMLCGFGTRKHLVECGGSLYVVDMYIEGEPHNPMGGFWEVVGVKVYRLDEEWGRWLDVKDLGGFVFVLGKDSNFSLPAQDYYGCEGNCVYFYSGGKACAFSLESSKFKKPNIFWPCPSLFHPKFNL